MYVCMYIMYVCIEYMYVWVYVTLYMYKYECLLWAQFGGGEGGLERAGVGK